MTGSTPPTGCLLSPWLFAVALAIVGCDAAGPPEVEIVDGRDDEEPTPSTDPADAPASDPTLGGEEQTDPGAPTEPTEPTEPFEPTEPTEPIAQADDDEPVSPSARIASPQAGEVQNPVQFVVEGAGVDTLSLSADGWPMVTWRPATDGWSATYTFQVVNTPRVVLLEGRDAAGNVVSSDEVIITVRDAWGAQLADDLIAHAADYLEEAWSNIDSGTPCVAFFAVGLRRHPDVSRRFPDFFPTVTEGPPSEACEIQGRCSLEARGFTGPHFDAADLRKGDICFTQDVVPFAGELWPDHSYVFVEWVEAGSTDFAWVIDNRQQFGTPYVRNITAPTQPGFDFTPFQYFMRSPYDAQPE